MSTKWENVSLSYFPTSSLCKVKVMIHVNEAYILKHLFSWCNREVKITAVYSTSY